MQTITTTFRAPTDTRGAKIQAKTTSGIKKVLDWDYALDTLDNHVKAAEALAKELKWDGEWFGGDGKDGEKIFVHPQGSPTFKVDKAQPKQPKAEKFGVLNVD